MEFNGNRDVLSLLPVAKAGDEEAFEQLLNVYRPMIDGAISRFTIDSRDAFSEACMSFYRAVSSYDVAKSGITFGLYAKICIERALIDLARRESKSASHFVDNEIDVESIAVPGGVQAMLEHREQTAYFLSVARSVLSDFEFEVYRQWMLGYKTSDIASVLGVTAKVVDNAKNRMWTKLRRALSPGD